MLSFFCLYILKNYFVNRSAYLLHFLCALSTAIEGYLSAEGVLHSLDYCIVRCKGFRKLHSADVLHYLVHCDRAYGFKRSAVLSGIHVERVACGHPVLTSEVEVGIYCITRCAVVVVVVAPV